MESVYRKDSAGSSGNTDTARAAVQYMRAGLSVIPVPAGQKNPNRGGWQNERHDVEDIPELWNNGQGIGALWGTPSGGLVDIDCDWPEATVAARYIAPQTRTFGRPGAPASHRVLRTTDTAPKTKRYKVPGAGGDNSVVELLSTGTQSLVPPSMHHSSERRAWYDERPTAEVSAVECEAIAADVATAALIARHWPGQGARHEYALAATGYIGRNLPRGRAERIMAGAIAASNDEEAANRHRDVADTLDDLAAERPTTGGPTLDTLAPGIVDRLRRWHGWGGVHAPSANGTGHAPKPQAGDSQGIIKALADAITAEDHFARDAGDKLYRFSGGCYRHYADRYIRQRVKELLVAEGKADKWSSHKASEVAEYIRADAPELWERPPLDEVNVANGILNLDTGELREHDPAYLSPVQIPVNHDPRAECPAWDKFVAEVFPEDAQDLAFELAADLITPSRSAQKALLLLGEGSNGKSTYLRALTAFVGSTNAAGVSLHKLESDRFSTARLIGKMANICPDLPSTHLTETSVFKAITGGDDLHGEYKYRESFEFKPYCRLVFSANHVPRSGDASHAFFRRWLVIPFNRTFEASEQVPREELDAALSDPGELSGVLNRALELMPKVRQGGFTESARMVEAWEEFKAMTDPVAVWLENNTVTGANAWVAKSALIAAYNKAAEDSGRAGLTAQAFGRAIKRARPDVGEAQRTVGGRQVKCYTGLGLKGGDGPEGGVGNDPRGVAPDPEGFTTATTATTDSTNCFGFEETLQEQGKGEQRDRQDKQERKNGSIGSNCSTGGWFAKGARPEPATPEALLADPPPWLAKQLQQCRTTPKLYKPTASAISAAVYGSPARWREVLPVLDRHLAPDPPRPGYEEEDV